MSRQAYEIRYQDMNRGMQYANSGKEAAQDFARECVHTEGNTRVDVLEKGTSHWRSFSVSAVSVRTISAFELNVDE